MIRAGSAEAKVGILMVRVVLDGEGRTSLSVMETVRSVVPILSTLLPKHWNDKEIIKRALWAEPDYENNIYWKQGAAIYKDYSVAKGRYTGSEAKVRELIEYAKGLKIVF